MRACVRACVHRTNNNETTYIAMEMSLKTKLRVKRLQSHPNYQQID